MTDIEFDREHLGRVHMEAWCDAARSMPGLSGIAFKAWEQHSEDNREADMIAAEAVAAEVLRDPRLIVLKVPTVDEAAPAERGQNFGGAGARLEAGGCIRISGAGQLPADVALRFAAYVATCARIAKSRDAEVEALSGVIFGAREAAGCLSTARAEAEAVLAAGWKRETQ